MKAQDLVGRWQINRTIFDAKICGKGKMQGVGIFHQLSPHELIYHEELWHETSSGSLHLARKSYRYRFENDLVAIYVHQEEDERLFLTLSPHKTRMKAFMQCGSDHYHLTWKWKGHDRFFHRYRFKGEKKHYLMESKFRKCD